MRSGPLQCADHPDGFRVACITSVMLGPTGAEQLKRLCTSALLSQKTFHFTRMHAETAKVLPALQTYVHTAVVRIALISKVVNNLGIYVKKSLGNAVKAEISSSGRVSSHVFRARTDGSGIG